MPTERVGPLNEEGFTLIEVLIAMLILAIGLLGLEALGIGAARSLAKAEENNELAAAAVGAMEQAQQVIRRNPAVVATGEACGTLPQTIVYVCTDVQTRGSLSTLPVRSARVIVRASRSATSTDALTVTSYVFNPGLP